MRRTYRSKRDTGGGVDYRDMLYNLDEKSSAFDAFYIQNIKQSKREQSCMASSNNNGAVSNRVRKRKFVRKLVKEIEPTPRDSLSTLRDYNSASVYLTPDKSIRVNKAPDPFDQLLNSSPVCSEEKQFKKVDLCGQILPGTPKERKTYKRKQKPIKKFNYSSMDDSDFDKENSNKTNEILTQNATDIKAHELIIEKTDQTSPKLDESINNIVRKLTLINNINCKGSGSLKKSLKCNKNRLTNNLQSPLFKTSPMSSTPFTDKTRSKSIYKFSPIPMGDLEDSPNNLTVIEDNENEVNKSIVFLPRTNTNFSTKCQGNSNPLFSSEADSQESEAKGSKVLNDKSSPKNDNEVNLVSPQLSSLQITEMEPFLGFSEDTIAKDNKNVPIMEIKDESIVISTVKVSNSTHKSREITPEQNKININSSIIEYSVPPEPFLGFTSQNNSIIDISAGHNSIIDFNVRNETDHSKPENHSAVNLNESDKLMSELQANNISHKIESILDSGDDSLPSQEVLNETVDRNVQDLNCTFSDTAKFDSVIKISAPPNEWTEQKELQKCNLPKEQASSILDSDDDLEAQNESFNMSVAEDENSENNLICKTSSNITVDDGECSISQNKNCDKNTSTTLSSFSSLSEQDSASERTSDESKNALDDDEKELSEQSQSDNDILSEEQDNEYQSVYDKQSIYDSCYSNESSNEDKTEEAILEEVHEDFVEKNKNLSIKKRYKEPKVVLERINVDLFKKYHSSDPKVAVERLNIDLFKKYYDKMPNDARMMNSSKELDDDSSEDYASFDDSDYIPEDLTEQETQTNNAIKNVTSTESDSDSCGKNTSSENMNESLAEKCVSFVTTRRRNDFTTDLTAITVLDDSLDSSGIECDKTVLSNNKIRLASPKKISDSNVVVVVNSENSSEHESDDSNEPKLPDTRMSFVTTRNSKVFRRSNAHTSSNNSKEPDVQSGIILQPGKRWERSLSIYRRMTTMNDIFDRSLLEDEEDLHSKGRKYRQSVICTMEMQEKSLLHNESIHNRRSTFVSKPSRSTIRIVNDTNTSRFSLSSTTIVEDLKGFIEDCDDTIVELSKLSLVDDHDVTVIEKLHETSRNTSARDYVLRRCNQSDVIPFDECYPDHLLKNCRKIGEGVYGEVFLWRAPDGLARVMKVVPIAGSVKVNGEQQKGFHEIIAEIVIAMELSALRAPIADINCHFAEGKEVDTLDLHSVENATDVFNEVLAVRCVYGSFPSRLLDLWELYDETVGSENDSPAILPSYQQYIALELANAGQDLESYQFNTAEQAYALLLQVAFALAVGEEAFQFEHRDLHWGNVLIAPTDQKYATFILRGRCHRIARRGVAATIIDYSLSRVLTGGRGASRCALYNDLAADEGLFTAVGDYQFQVYRLMRDKLGNDWKNFEPYTNILWLHYTVDKMITALRYKKTTTKVHKQYINKLKGIKERLLGYGSAAQFVLTDNELY